VELERDELIDACNNPCSPWISGLTTSGLRDFDSDIAGRKTRVYITSENKKSQVSIKLLMLPRNQIIRVSFEYTKSILGKDQKR
jgi:hypothetical protein